MAIQPKAMYIQPDVIYSHLLIDGYNDVEPCIHLGLDDIDVVKRSYIEGETSKEIYTWHSDEKMKRIESQRDALLEALRLMMDCAGVIATAPDSMLEMALTDGDEETRRQANAFLVARAAIKAVEG